jgi:hypothetical protein
MTGGPFSSASAGQASSAASGTPAQQTASAILFARAIM